MIFLVNKIAMAGVGAGPGRRIGRHTARTSARAVPVKRRNTIMKTASVALATMVLATAAFAANAQPLSGAGMLDRLDADHDGKITREESAAARERMFKRLDRNGDGAVDETEVEQARQMIKDRAATAEARLSNQWRRMDKDGDGKVSAAEFQSRSVMFDLADRNGDGTITENEVDFMRGLFGRAG
jgi:Ca2+-binding EF-hand superfamily protein